MHLKNYIQQLKTEIQNQCETMTETINLIKYSNGVSLGGGDSFYNKTHLRAGQMSDIGEPVNMSATMIKGMNELVGDHSVHMGLILNIILAQNNLEGTNIREIGYFQNVLSFHGSHPLSHMTKFTSLTASTHSSPPTPHRPTCQGPVLTTWSYRPSQWLTSPFSSLWTTIVLRLRTLFTYYPHWGDCTNVSWTPQHCIKSVDFEMK